MHERVALVTGAGSGIGAAVARRLGERGAAVAAVDRDEAAVRRVAEKLRAGGIPALAVPADVRSGTDAQRAVATAEQHLGPVGQLALAAGVLRTGAAWELSDEEWEQSLATNVTGVFTMTRAAAPGMIARSGGAVVTVASNAAGTARTGMAAYSASKAAATAYTRCLGLELAGHGIRCNVVAPGSTDTPMLHSLWTEPSSRERTLSGDQDAYRVGIPLRRLAAPEDIADAVAFLLSEDAAHITMHTLTVDGGATLGV